MPSTDLNAPGAQRLRRPRSDALRNRERLLAAARRVFAAGGAQASLEGVAREAGVGVATLYRHFPTRQALFEAVYRREVDEMAALAERMSADGEPVEALRLWLHRAVDLVATKKGMIAALALAIDSSSEVYQYSARNLTRAVQLFLDRAISQGRVRTDIAAEDLLRALIGVSHPDARPGWREQATRILDVLVDGLSPR